MICQLRNKVKILKIKKKKYNDDLKFSMKNFYLKMMRKQRIEHPTY